MGHWSVFLWAGTFFFLHGSFFLLAGLVLFKLDTFDRGGNTVDRPARKTFFVLLVWLDQTNRDLHCICMAWHGIFPILAKLGSNWSAQTGNPQGNQRNRAPMKKKGRKKQKECCQLPVGLTNCHRRSRRQLHPRHRQLLTLSTP